MGHAAVPWDAVAPWVPGGVMALVGLAGVRNSETRQIVPAGTLAAGEEEEENRRGRRGAAWHSLKKSACKYQRPSLAGKEKRAFECLGGFSNPVGVLGGEMVVMTHGGGLQLPESLRKGGFN